MPKVSSKDSAKTKRHAEPAPSFADEDVSVSSVLFGLVMIAALVVAAAAFMGGSLNQLESKVANTTDSMARSVGLAVTSVSVIGLDHDPVLKSDVRAAAMVEPGENMFRADPHAIRARVEATRKVVNVRVHRLWPDQIVVMVDPAEPMALYHDGEDWAVIDTLGRTMDIAPADYAGLPRLTGTGADAAALDLVVQLDLVPELRDGLLYAERVAERRWNLHMQGGTVALMPRDGALGDALVRLDTLQFQTGIADRGLARVDLRQDGPVYLTPAAHPRQEGQA
ncbi:MAG: FtsQ-type POTRA domain-containing protein [Hyphomonadaceae bacterium]|nr:FtsQ-type POTRA domain-containing protein [Hyphomonadaceae bacterium]